MCYIELKNEKYETLEDLKRLLHYILRLDKTAEDSQRANTITNTLAGCQPAMIPNEYLCDPSSVYHLMLFEVRRRHKGIPQFAKHRIVSFAATDCILPQDVVSLAERIASIYAKNGYITAYTLQKVREVVNDSYSYSSDYEVIGKLKQFADRDGVCVLIVHHTRKQPAGDSFEMISGTTGLLGCADGALLMQKEKRTNSKATLEVVGRDQPDQRLYLS